MPQREGQAVVTEEVEQSGKEGEALKKYDEEWCRLGYIEELCALVD